MIRRHNFVLAPKSAPYLRKTSQFDVFCCIENGNPTGFTETTKGEFDFYVYGSTWIEHQYLPICLPWTSFDTPMHTKNGLREPLSETPRYMRLCIPFPPDCFWMLELKSRTVISDVYTVILYWNNYYWRLDVSYLGKSNFATKRSYYLRLENLARLLDST